MDSNLNDPGRTPSSQPDEEVATPTISRSALKKLQKQAEKAERALARQTPPSETTNETDYASENYGVLPLNQSQERKGRPVTSIASLRSAPANQEVLVRARIYTSRYRAKIAWVNLRQSIETIQSVVVFDDAEKQISKQMVKWAGSLDPETIVLVEGTTRAPNVDAGKDAIVKSATVDHLEILVKKMFVVSEVKKKPLPFNMEDAGRAASEYEKEGAEFNKVLLDNRLDNRVLDLRTPTNQAIFRLTDAVTTEFESFLRAKGFIRIHSPKLQGAATESGASVFSVDYFRGKAYLAQSPQLAKQMAIASDFERVYEIGPVFRAENANTHRHMTEFTGLDLEMVIEEHYHEVMEMLDSLFLHIFRALRDNHSREIEIVRMQFPAEEFKWREGKEGTLKLTFAEAADLLVEDGVPREHLDDISTENEKRLGRIVRHKYETDYFIVDKFPLALRAFYSMPDATDPKLSNAFDFFMRGEEVLSGAQRIHDPDLLVQHMITNNIDPESMRAYIDAFELGCPPHGGGGIGLERVVMLFLKLGNIRRASLFPRDPKRLAP